MIRTRKRKKICLAVIIAGSIAALTLCSLYVSALRTRSRARKFLLDLSTLRVGRSSYLDAARLASRYGGEPWPAFPKCTSDDCYFYVTFNGLPIPISVRPKVRLSALVHVRNGTVSAIEVTYECDASSVGRTVYDVLDSSSDKSAPQNEIYRWESPSYGVAVLEVDEHAVPWQVLIFLGKDATPQQRQTAFDIDLSCLAKTCKCEPSTVVPNAILKPLEARLAGRQPDRVHMK